MDPQQTGFFLVMLVILAGLADAQTPSPTGVGRLDVAMTSGEITVGDQIEAQITLVWTGPTPTAEPRFPAWDKTWGPAEILHVGAVELFDQGVRRVYRQTLRLTAFDTGEVELPAIVVKVALGEEQVVISSEERLGFTVTSVLPDDPAEISPREAAPLRPPARQQRFLWALAPLVGAILLLAWLVTRRLATNAQPAMTTPALPLDELLHRLRQLDPTVAEPAHTGLSLGLRHFLGRSLGFGATECTTSEIQRQLRRAPVPADIARGTVLLLRDCDEVKFARQPVEPALTDDRLNVAIELAQQIDHGLRPEPTPEEAVG